MDFQQRRKLIKKITKGLIIALFVFVVGGVGGVYFDHQILPGIRANKYLSRWDFFKKATENVTVIYNTEQVTVKEDDAVKQVASQAANAVVNIVSIAKPSSGQKAGIGSSGVDNLSGTGVIATSDGLIVTYRRAILENNAQYKVFLPGGATYDASLTGIDGFTDLAFLKIDASNLTAISLADSADFHPGRKLIAIGNSFGEYQNRFAAGLLSNNDRTFNLAGKTLSSSEKLEGVFETDFAEQAAFLGGPVIGYGGSLVGIIGSLSIDNQPHYFQIPANVVKAALDLAVSGKLEKRPVLGIYYVPITKQYSIVHDLPTDRGALIYSPSGKQGLAIITGSPAQVAGLQLGDIITSVGEKGVNLDNPLSNLLSQYKKGEMVDLTILRAGNELKLPVRL